MGHKKNKGKSKQGKSNKRIRPNNQSNIYIKEQQNTQKKADAVYNQNVIQGKMDNISDTIDDNNAATFENTSDTNSESTNTNNVDTNSNNINTTTDAELNDCCEEIKEKQQQLFDRLKRLSESLVALTLIRDDVNSLTVDTLTELYFTRQVRPLLDALNIISFASSNMSATATAIQTSALGETKEIKNALKLSYKMNDEIDDIISSLGRRLTIFLKQIDTVDRNCPPFNSGKDS